MYVLTIIDLKILYDTMCYQRIYFVDGMFEVGKYECIELNEPQLRLSNVRYICSGRIPPISVNRLGTRARVLVI